MLINKKRYSSIWFDHTTKNVKIIDQRRLPHKLEVVDLLTLNDFCIAIKDMYVRGAPLIGVTAAYGMAEALRHDASDASISNAYESLIGTRPTAVNLRWAIDMIVTCVKNFLPKDRFHAALTLAHNIAAEDIKTNYDIGKNGAEVIEKISRQKNGNTVNILTHCNAGWLATVDLGTATAPIYRAIEDGIDVHVWVDETRPRNQGASLTAWELTENNVPNTLIVDNAGGHLMQQGMVDVVLVGSDRTTANGDVCNKIGTYLKALSAKDNSIPFYAALPTSTIDFNLHNGADIEIEERDPAEVLKVSGLHDGKNIEVDIASKGVIARNPAFDVTPSRLVTGIITQNGICNATSEDIMRVNGHPE